MNDSWGYHRADDAWKTPKQVIRNLITCAHDGGNYLINIGPKADGSIPDESVRILSTVGDWMDKNGSALYGADNCQPTRCRFGSFSRHGNTLFLHIQSWPGSTVALAGMKAKVVSAKLLSTGKNVDFKQDAYRIQFTGLPEKAPDFPLTTIAIDFDSVPTQDNIFVRNRERGNV
jgi:alpha-L-fucosidase